MNSLLYGIMFMVIGFYSIWLVSIIQRKKSKEMKPERTLTLKEVNEMDTRFRNAHKKLLALEKSMGKKDFYFILERHFRGRTGTAYIPKFDI